MAAVAPLARHATAANAITSLSVVASVGAILLAVQGQLLAALLVGAVPLPCDVLDGAIARWRGTASDFGAQLDSLSDAIGFGVLPAVLGYVLGVQGPASVALVAYSLGAVWRLARFAQIGLTLDARGRECFTGMPTTYAAALFFIAAPASLWLGGMPGRGLLVVFFVSASLLMNGEFAFPKRGWHTRVLWFLVPLSVASLLLRPS